MALTEALRLVIDADVKGAVKGFQQVGTAAEKDLGKSEKRIDKMGSTMSKAGVGMLGAGVLIAGGLFKAAQASEEAEKQTLKLQNSIDNSAKMAGHSSKEFTDLATAIQSKTAADADDIVGGQAVLIQMGLEADQIKELTPLVVDLARKKGIDMAAAATIVAKAEGGQMGAMKKANIVIDEAAYKTDRHKAIVDALAGSVGGFAEKEGKTFSGSIERMKNQLGDLSEGVGKGAVEAFSGMLGGVDNVVGGLNKLDPSMQAVIGKTAAYTATGLIAAGTMATLVGKAIEMRGAFDNGAGGLTKMGKAGLALGAIGIAASVYSIAKSAQDLTFNIEGLADASDDATKDMADKWQELTDLIGKGEMGKSFAKLADDNLAGAKRLRDALADQGVDVRELDTILKDTASSQRQLSEDQGNAADVSAELTGETEQTTEALKAEQDAADKAREAYNRYIDAVMGSIDAESGYRHSIDATEDSLIKLHDAAVASADGKSKDAALNEVYKRQLDETADTIRDQAEAATELRVQQDAANGVTDNAAAKARIHKEELEKVAQTLSPDDPLRKRLDEYIFILGTLDGKHVTTIIETSYTTGSAGGGGAFKPGGGKRPSLGTEGGDPNRAMGGPVTAGQPYIVGEHRPELFVPNTSGRIIPSLDGLGGGAHYHYHGDVADPFQRAVAADWFDSMSRKRERERGSALV